MAYVEIDTVDGKTLKNGVDLEERMKSAQQKWDLVSKKFVRIMKGVIADDQVNRLVQQVDQLQASKKFDASAYAIEVADK